MELRSQKTQSIRQSISRLASQSTISNPKCNKSKSPLFSTIKQSNSNGIDQLKVFWEKKFESVENDIKLIKSDLKTQAEASSQSIDQIRDEINTKGIAFNAVLDSLKHEIASISQRSSQESSHSIVNTNIDGLNGYLFQLIQKMHALEANVIVHHTEIFALIDELSTNDKFLEESIVQLVLRVNSSDLSQCSDDVSFNSMIKRGDEFESLRNAIECVQYEINKVNNAIIKSEEKCIKMNEQIHVLSAKFINFNAKLNEHLFIFNRQSAEPVNKDQIIDNDASKFLVASNSIKKPKEKKENKFIAQTESNNRFAQPFNKHECSKLVKVSIHNCEIHNLSSFSEEFDQYMRKTLGMKLIRSITIAKYVIVSNIVQSIVVNVAFNVPISCDYLANFIMPTNWFLHSTRSNNTFVTTRINHPLPKHIHFNGTHARRNDVNNE